jgi:hypothetical protein
MITAAPKRTITALKIRNLVVFDPGTTSRESWLIAAPKLAWKIATSSTLKPGAVVEPHEQGAGEEQRDELDGEDDRCRNERLESPAFLSEVVGQVPYRPEQCHAQRELHWAVPVLPMMLKETSESDLLSKLEQHPVAAETRRRPRQALAASQLRELLELAGHRSRAQRVHGTRISDGGA